MVRFFSACQEGVTRAKDHICCSLLKLLFFPLKQVYSIGAYKFDVILTVHLR